MTILRDENRRGRREVGTELEIETGAAAREVDKCGRMTMSQETPRCGWVGHVQL